MLRAKRECAVVVRKRNALRPQHATLQHCVTAVPHVTRDGSSDAESFSVAGRRARRRPRDAVEQLATKPALPAAS